MNEIKKWREITGLSQTKFANLLGIPAPNIPKWEQGVTAPPDYVLGLIRRDLEHKGYVLGD